MGLSVEEKEKILKALEEDREFRYALMGLLGFKEILERITRIEEIIARIEERQQKLEERQQRLEERQQKLEERQQKLEERFAKLEERFAELEKRQLMLEERFARLEERQQKLEERMARIEERFARLEERQLKLEERMARLEEEMNETRRVLTVIAHRFGVLSESAFREAMKYVVEEKLGAGRVSKMSLRDEEGLVYGYPSIIDIDVVVKDDKHILVEVKSRVSRGDVYEIYRIGKLYEKIKGIKPVLVIVGGFIDPKAYEAAAKLGVEVKPAIRES